MKESTVACRVARALLSMETVCHRTENGMAYNTILWQLLSQVCELGINSSSWKLVVCH